MGAKIVSVAVVILDADAYASSESEINAAVLRLLPRMYDEIVPNPVELPEEPYDLWAVMPFECAPVLPWETLSDNAQARVAIDMCDQFPGIDVYLTLTTTAPRNDTVDRLFGLWGVLWRGEPIHPRWRFGWQRPHLPYVHACSDDALLNEPRLPHVVWNVEHWADNGEEHAFAAAAIPMLVGLGVQTVFQSRADRGGPVDVESCGLTSVVLIPPQQPDGVGGAAWERLVATGIAYLVSVPSLGMLSIPKALACGIPVVAAPVGQWSDWMTLPRQLAAYRDPGLYAQAREQAYHTFSDDRAVGQFRLALSMARALREAR
jgi:hypothetical protein